jgi:hypothetical protein
MIETVSGSGLDSFQQPPGGRPTETRSADDPVSWLQIEQGWIVVTADGVEIGTVAQVAGSKQDDVFDGLAVEGGGRPQVGYIAGEQVGLIYPGRVTLKTDAEHAADLPAYREAPRHETLRPRPESLASRASTWFRRR